MVEQRGLSSLPAGTKAKFKKKRSGHGFLERNRVIFKDKRLPLGQPSLFDRASIYFIRQGVQIRDITILEVVLLVLLNYILTDNLLH